MRNNCWRISSLRCLLILRQTSAYFVLGLNQFFDVVPPSRKRGKELCVTILCKFRSEIDLRWELSPPLHNDQTEFTRQLGV